MPIQSIFNILLEARQKKIRNEDWLFLRTQKEQAMPLSIKKKLNTGLD